MEETKSDKGIDYLSVILIGLLLGCISYMLCTELNLVQNESIKIDILLLFFVGFTVFVLNLFKKLILNSIVVIVVIVFYHLNFNTTKVNEQQNNQQTEMVEIPSTNETAPKGYHKGNKCSDCEGTGKLTHDNALGKKFGAKGAICAGCNGKGFHWVKD